MTQLYLNCGSMLYVNNKNDHVSDILIGQFRWDIFYRSTFMDLQSDRLFLLIKHCRRIYVTKNKS
jgi:hypothetical protein